MTDKQPEALRLATVLENKLGGASDEDIEQAAAELRRLHAVNQELLEALEEEAAWLGSTPKGAAAITALRERLAQPEQHQDWCASLTQMLLSMPPKPAPCNCKPAKPEQEPVAALTKAQAKTILDMALDLEKTGRIVSLSEGQERSDFVSRNRNIERALRDYLQNLTEQDTTPPRREWVGLTNGDKAELDEKYGDDPLAHLDAIEAKLRELNS